MEQSKIKFYILSIIITNALLSCTGVKVLPYQENQKQTINSTIFFVNDYPSFKYEKLAFIEISRSIFTSNEKLVSELSKKALEKGFDAVIEVDFFYIPHFITGIPAIRGIGVKRK